MSTAVSVPMEPEGERAPLFSRPTILEHKDVHQTMGFNGDQRSGSQSHKYPFSKTVNVPNEKFRDLTVWYK